MNSGRTVMSELLSTLELKKENDGWFVKFILDEDLRLKSIFWMSPVQRELYLRYSDVVFNDNTCNTNMFNMPLGTFVIIDNNGSTRIIASTITSSESVEDHEWILTCLMEAVNGNQPGVLFSDQDPALISAVSNILHKSLHKFCIWHIASINIPRKLKGTLGGNWGSFMSRWWMVRNSLTEEIFDITWKRLLLDFPVASDYLKTNLYSTRQQWGWPWIASVFTAGAQSTQRVEKTQHLLKTSLSSISTPLEMFASIEKRVQDEANKGIHLQYDHDMGISGNNASKTIESWFPEVDRINAKYLGFFALARCRQEMVSSLNYVAVQQSINYDNDTTTTTTDPISTTKTGEEEEPESTVSTLLV